MLRTLLACGAQLGVEKQAVGDLIYVISFVIFQSVAVAVAVLVARWIEPKLAIVSRKTCMSLVVALIAAVFVAHLRVSVGQPQLVPISDS
ncbi:MAG: hypothetical protein AAF967_10625 [Pseudomonadota bacterium]